MPQDQHGQAMNQAAGGRRVSALCCFVLRHVAQRMAGTLHGTCLEGSCALGRAEGRSAGNIPEANTHALDVHDTGAMDKG